MGLKVIALHKNEHDDTYVVLLAFLESLRKLTCCKVLRQILKGSIFVVENLYLNCENIQFFCK